MCCSNDTAHVHLVGIFFPPSKYLKEMQRYFILNIGLYVSLILTLAPLPLPTTHKKYFIFMVYAWCCVIFSCYLSSSTFMRYAYASAAE